MIIQAYLFHPNAGSALRPDDPGSTWIRFAKLNTNVSEGPAITDALFVTIFCRLSRYADLGNPFCFRYTVLAVPTSEKSRWNLQITPIGFYTNLQEVPRILTRFPATFHRVFVFFRTIARARLSSIQSENELICDQ